MSFFIFRRFLSSLLLILVTTAFIFGISRARGDPRSLYLNEYMTQEQWDALGVAMGLDRPIVLQYLVWLGDAVRLDFGISLHDQVDPISMIRQRIPATFQLGAGALVFTFVTAIPLGVLSAVKRGTVWDYIGRTFALLGQAMPGFWLGIILILIFSVQFELLPTGRRGGLDHLILPSITLGWFTSAGLLRLVRSSMLQVLDSEYVKFARAKGVANNTIIWKHAFRNALIPPLTYAGLLMGAFMTGAVVTEQIFAWPGLGRLAINSVFNNDFPVMVAVVMFFTVLYVGTALLIDILYAVVDPRIKYG